jgi:hypothetical protein
MVKLGVMCTWFIMVQRYGLLTEEMIFLNDLQCKFGPHQDMVSITNFLNCPLSITYMMALSYTPHNLLFYGGKNCRSLGLTTDGHLAPKS